MNMPFTAMSSLFNSSRQTVSNVFLDTLDVLKNKGLMVKQEGDVPRICLPKARYEVFHKTEDVIDDTASQLEEKIGIESAHTTSEFKPVIETSESIRTEDPNFDVTVSNDFHEEFKILPHC